MHVGVGSPDLSIAIDDGVLSNRDLLNHLRTVAVGIRDFVALGARLELTQLIVEVKDKLVLVGNGKSFTTSEYAISATKSKTRGESLQKSSSRHCAAPASRPKLTPPAKTKDNGPVLPEAGTVGRDNLLFSDAYVAKKINISRSSVSLVGKRSNTSGCSRQSSPCSTSGTTKLFRTPQARQRSDIRAEYNCSDVSLAPKKKPRVSGNTTVKQLLRALASEKRALPDAAVAAVVAVKKQHEAAKAEMTELLEEIRAMEYDNYNDLPPNITAIWISAHAKQLRNSLDLQCTVLRHALGSITSCKELPV